MSGGGNKGEEDAFIEATRKKGEEGDGDDDGLAEAENMVMEELTQAEKANEGEADGEAGEDWGDFKGYERLVLRAAEGVNRPFGFVPEGAKDTLGLVAIVTVICAIIGAAVLLLSR